MAEELTVLVKKADGTFERRPLGAVLIRAAVKDKVLPDQPALKPAPVLPAAGRGDEPPLLEEAEPGGAGPRRSPGREQIIEKIVKSLSFTVAGNAANRLRSAVQLFLKDVRTPEQTLAILVRPAPQGGVGLAPTQAREVLARGNDERLAELRQPAATNVPVLVNRNVPPRAALPRRAAAVSVSAPPPPAAPRPGAEIAAAPPAFQLSRRERPVITDVVAPKITVGPVEELGALTITDFRRLAADPPAAAGAIADKFARLRSESVLLWLLGRQSWRGSPLYQNYLATTASALNERRKLAEFTAGNNQLSGAEVAALAEMAYRVGL
ncbi:MAG: hypothetical protein HYV42_02180 [Candidatus Magasanikbacteria bacterium]|nr:hypothetical protein [Candidatus Magasanikbacteria bacterium]